MTWPQPREGITGTSRVGDPFERLLSLDEDDIPVRLAVLELAHCLWDALLVGDPAPRVKRMWDRVKRPQPGDLVAEVSMSKRRPDLETRVHAFGVLLDRPRQEWAETDDEWAAAMADEPEWLRGDDNRNTDRAWYIQYGPDAEDVCRWVNCDFYLVPTDASFYLIPFGQPTATGGVMFERSDLVASLGDSGFRLKPQRDRSALQSYEEIHREAEELTDLLGRAPDGAMDRMVVDSKLAEAGEVNAGGINAQSGFLMSTIGLHALVTELRQIVPARAGHYHDPLGKYDFCDDPRCPRLAT